MFLCVRGRERVKSLIPGIEEGKLSQCEEKATHILIQFCAEQQCPLCLNHRNVSSNVLPYICTCSDLDLYIRPSYCVLVLLTFWRLMKPSSDLKQHSATPKDMHVKEKE